jgi:hypothetical protein
MCENCNPLETNTSLVQYTGPTTLLCNGNTITNGEDLTSVISKIQNCINILTQEVNITGLIENSACITLIGSSIKDVFQSILNTESTFCTQIADIQTQINDILNIINGSGAAKTINITSCNTSSDITVTETPTSKTFKLGAFVPKNTVLPYFGSINDFYSNGLGKASAGMNGWAIANGFTHNVNGVNVTTVNACGKYLKYDCTGCCTTGGSNTVTLGAANIPELSFNLNAEFTLSGSTHEAGEHTHNVISSNDSSPEHLACSSWPALLVDAYPDCNSEFGLTYGPNPVTSPPVPCPGHGTCLNSPIQPYGLHTHTFDATASGAFTGTIPNSNLTPVNIEPEFIAGIPIQYIGGC